MVSVPALIGEMAFSLAYVGLAYVLVIGAKFLLDALTPYHLDDHLTLKDNFALGISITGYFAGVIIIFLGVSIGPEAIDPETGEALAWTWRSFLVELGLIAGYSIAGIVLLNVGRLILDKIVLNSFCITKEIIEDHNAGTGAIEAGTFIATALVTAGALNGQGGGPVTAIVFWVLGQITLILFGLFYRAITSYDLHKEVEDDNVAAGVAYGLSLVAIGVVLCKGTTGAFVSWTENLIDFGLYGVFGFVVLFVIRLATDGMLLPKVTIHQEIAEDRNVAAAFIEGTLAIGMASVIFFLL